MSNSICSEIKLRRWFISCIYTKAKRFSALLQMKNVRQNIAFILLRPLFFCINHWYLHTGGEGIMTLWRTEWRIWVNRTIHNHQKSPHQSVINFRPEPRETWSSREILPKDLKLSHQLMQKKHRFKLPRLIITTTNVFLFSLNTRKMTQSDYAAMILLWHVNYRDTQMWFHNFSTAVSAQHTTHASILFQNIKSHIFC